MKVARGNSARDNATCEMTSAPARQTENWAAKGSVRGSDETSAHCKYLGRVSD